MKISKTHRLRSKSCAAWRPYGMGEPAGKVGGMAYLCSGSHVAFLIKGHRERDRHQVRGDMTSSLPGLS